MPEYSSTTITPADGVKTPAMNGSTSGNYTLSTLRDYILASKGAANGLASLDANGKLNSSQIPDLADDVIVVDSYSTLPATGTAGKLYITADTNRGYRWDPDLATPDYVMLFENNVVFGYMHNGSFYEDDEYTVEITPEENILYIDVSISDIYVLVDGVLTELLASKWAKIADIQDGSITAGLATKAWQDAMGNAIITTYATKSELTSEATARANADSNLKGAIDANSARITNLEQEHGGYVTVNYRGTNSVPTGKAKYGLVESIVGKSRPWTQEMNDSPYNASVSKSGSTVTVTWDNSLGDSKFGTISTAVPLGHKVLVSVNIVSVSVTNFTKIRFGNGVNIQTSVGLQSFIATPSGLGSVALFVDASSFVSGDKFVYKDFVVRDLTLIFPEGVPSTVAECVQKCPSILDYDAYGYSIVDTVVERVETTSINVNDEIYEIGSIDANGQNDDSVTTASRNKNYTPVSPSTQYFINSSAWQSYKTYNANFGFEGNGTYSATTGGYILNIGANVHYIRFVFQGTSPTNIQICLNSYADKTTYHPHILDTISLPQSVTLRSAGSVAEVYDLESGEKTNPIGSVTYDGSEDESWSQYSTNTFFSVKSDMKSASSNVLANLTCNRLENVIRDNIYNAPNTICTESTYFMVTAPSTVTDVTGFKAWIASNPVTINYELATPNAPTQLEPVLDPMIQIEGGGTINTIQTQSPEIDNSLDVGYLAL